MAELPSGTVTFLFTDLVSSTRLWEEQPESMEAAVARHDEILRLTVAAHNGYVVKATGDGVHAAFAAAHHAIDAALDAQRTLATEPWPEAAPLSVRIGLHTGEAQERDGDYYGSAVNRAARVMAVAHGGQIVCSRATVEVAGAHAAFLSLGEHRLRDLGAPQELFQVGVGSFPPLQSLDVVPTNLPMVLTELIGRSEDVDRIATLLEHERLITLTGVGGVGKTRLALAVAGASVDAFPDGVWFVELAPVDSANEVVRAAANALGVVATDRSGLATYLSDRRALLVLDNCEHVLDAAAALAEAILVAGPETVILATSREPLAVEGETVRGVRSLPVPDAEVDDDAVVAAAPAVRLFVDRASAATDDFELTDADLPTVAAICAQLDGIPLAIELAASRVRVMSSTEIAARLGERFRLLAGGRGSQERHRTLQATVSWSYDLLDEIERRVFRRLAVFPASFDLDGADAVAGDADTYVLDGLLRLVEQSLVQHEATSRRYRLLETLRQYATDRLVEAGEADAIVARHADHYVGWTARNASLGGFPSADAFEQFGVEADNLQAAADWLVANERWAALLRLGRHHFPIAFASSPVRIVDWYSTALGHSPELEGQERVDALGEFEYLLTAVGRPTDAIPESSVTLADASGLVHSPWSWFARFLDAQARVNMADALTAGERMLAVAQQRDDELGIITALGLVAGFRAMGNPGAIFEFADEGLRRARAIANPTALAIVVSTAAGGMLTNGVDPDFKAGLAFLEANPVDFDTVSFGGRLWLHFEWGLALLGTGRSDRAVLHLTRSLRLADQGYPAAQQDVARAVAVALGEAGYPVLALEVAGYATANFADYSPTGGTQTWLRPRLDTVEATLDATESAAAFERGVQLDRRGFMRLLADVDRRFGVGARGK